MRESDITPLPPEQAAMIAGAGGGPGMIADPIIPSPPCRPPPDRGIDPIRGPWIPRLPVT